MGKRSDDTVAADLRAIARRYNGLTLQHWIALATALSIGTVALLTVVALRGSATAFNRTLLSGVLLLALAWTYAAARIWRAWLASEHAAAFADRLAGLDGRLSTWTANPDRAATSPLGPILLEQIIRARDRWAPAVLVPRRTARALALIPLMLLFFAASAFYARPPRLPVVARPLDATAAVVGAAPGEAASTGHQQSTDPTSSGAHPMSSTLGAAGSGAARAGSDPGSAASEGGTGSAGSALQPAAEPGRADRLRNAIRDAFGAEAPTAETHAGLQPGGTRSGQGDAAGRPPAQEAAGRPPAPGEGAKPQQPAAAAEQARGGSAATAGGQGGGAAGAARGLFGAGGTASSSDLGEQTRIRLGAIAAIAPQHSEPQRGDQPPQSIPASTGTTHSPSPDLADHQLDDAVVHKAEIGPQYEPIVRRVFRRE